MDDLEYAELAEPIYKCEGLLIGADGTQESCPVSDAIPQACMSAGVKCPRCGSWKWKRLWPEVDPRQGPLHALCRLVEKQDSKEENEP